jgi:hypothetical protein
MVDLSRSELQNTSFCGSCGVKTSKLTALAAAFGPTHVIAPKTYPAFARAVVATQAGANFDLFSRKPARITKHILHSEVSQWLFSVD